MGRFKTTSIQCGWSSSKNLILRAARQGRADRLIGFREELRIGKRAAPESGPCGEAGWGGLMNSLSPFVPALQAKPSQPGAKQQERGGLGNRLIAGRVLAESCAEGENHLVDPSILGYRYVQKEGRRLIDERVVGAIARNRAVGGIVHPVRAGWTDDSVRRHCLGSQQVSANGAGSRSPAFRLVEASPIFTKTCRGKSRSQP